MTSVPVSPLQQYIGQFVGSGYVPTPGLLAWISEHEIEPPARLTLRWPVAGDQVVTQRYGIHPLWYKPFGLPGHEGIDIRAVDGTPVLAMADGEVVRVELSATNNAYGVHVRVKHLLAEEEYESIYAHFRIASPAVQVGQPVAAGQMLGKADNTGNSSGAHLHITLKHKGKGSPWMGRDIVNPTPYLPMLFPGRGWAVDVGGNLRSGPAETFPILTWVPANSRLDALDFGGAGGDWWMVALATGERGWFWNPGYKLSPL